MLIVLAHRTHGDGMRYEQKDTIFGLMQETLNPRELSSVA